MMNTFGYLYTKILNLYTSDEYITSIRNNSLFYKEILADYNPYLLINLLSIMVFSLKVFLLNKFNNNLLLIRLETVKEWRKT